MPVRNATPDDLAAAQDASSPNIRQATAADLAAAGESTTPVQTTDPNSHPPSLLDRLGGLSGLAAGGIRALSGILSAEGGAPGALTAGGGEALAQLVGGESFQNPTGVTTEPNEDPWHARIRGFFEGIRHPFAQIATEGAAGAIPFGKIVRPGEAVASALRSGAMGAGRELTSQVLGGQSIDPTQIATTGALGALLGAAGSRFGTPEPTKPSMTTPPIIEQQPGNQVFRVPAGVVASRAQQPMEPSTQSMLQDEIRKTLSRSLNKIVTAADKQKAEQVAADAAEKANQDRLAEIQRLRTEFGLTDPSLTSGETITGNSPLGKESARITYSVPEEDEEALTTPGQGAARMARMSASVKPPAGSDAEKALQGWLDRGLSPKLALTRVQQGIAPEEAGVEGPYWRTVPKRTGTSALPEDSSTWTEAEPIGPAAAPAAATPAPVSAESTPKTAAETIADLNAHTRAGIIAAGERAKAQGLPADRIDAIVQRTLAGIPEAPAEDIPAASPVAAVAKALAVKPSKTQRFQSQVDKILGQVGTSEPAAEATAVPSAGGLPTEPEARSAVQAAVSPLVQQLQASLAQGGATAPESTSALASFFKTPADALGTAYRAAKAAQQGGEAINPLAVRQLGIGLKGTEKPSATLGKFLSEKVSPELTAPSEQIAHVPAAGAQGAGTIEQASQQIPNNAESAAAAAEPEPQDWVKKQLGIVDRLKALAQGEGSGGIGGGEAGAINPAFLTKAGMTLGGATIGAPVGAYYSDPEDRARGALMGALGGGILGYAGSVGMLDRRPNQTLSKAASDELVNWRNAGLLAGPAQLKKPLSDLGTYVGTALEKAASNNPQDREVALNLLKEMLNVPTNVTNYAKGMIHPELSREIIPNVDLGEYTQGGALGAIARPFAAAQYATQQAMQRAGMSPEEAKTALMVSSPLSKAGGWWVAGQKVPVIRALVPFARIATNILEQGAQRLPGASYLSSAGVLPKWVEGDPNTRLARSLMGLATMGAGYATGRQDSEGAQLGEPTSPLTKGLRRALMARYGLPFTIGEALGGSGAKEVQYMIPGASGETFPQAAPGDTLSDYVKKFGTKFLDQILPSALTPSTPATGGQAR